MPLGSQKVGLMAASAGGDANYFGDGSDGAVTSSTDITYTPANTSGSFLGDMVVKNFTTFVLSVGDTLTVDNGCSGLLLYSTGNMTINGTISMNARGTSLNTGWTADNPINEDDAIWLPMLTASPGSQALTVAAPDFTNCGAVAVAAVANQPGIAGDGTLFTVSGGPNGGLAAAYNSANAGGVGSGGVRDEATYEIWIRTGGGGGGGAQQNSSGGAWSTAGGQGSPISGGSGGGGVGASGGSGSAVPAVVGATGKGGGGSGYHGDPIAAGGGGAGQPGGNGSAPNWVGNDGNGGIIWLICGGVLTLGASSTITSTGTVGGSAGGSTSGGGGGSGGGVAQLIYVTSYTDSGCTFSFAGGSGGGANGPGGAGGTGAYIATQVLGV